MAVIDTLFSIGLTQINFNFNSLNRILDLVFISDSLKVTVNACTPFLANSIHHNAISINITNYMFENLLAYFNRDSFRYKFSIDNLNTLNEHFNAVNWCSELHHNNLAANFIAFSAKFRTLLASCVPKVHKRVGTHPPWSNNRLCKLKKMRKVLLISNSKATILLRTTRYFHG